MCWEHAKWCLDPLLLFIYWMSLMTWSLDLQDRARQIHQKVMAIHSDRSWLKLLLPWTTRKSDALTQRSTWECTMLLGSAWFLWQLKEWPQEAKGYVCKNGTKLSGLNDSKWFWMWLSQTLVVPKSPIPYSKLVWCIMGPAPSWSSGWCPNRKQSPSDHPGPCRACRACCAWRQFPGGRGEGFETKPAMHSWALTKNTVGWLYYMA